MLGEVWVSKDLWNRKNRIFGQKCIEVLRLKRVDVLWPPLGSRQGENDWRNIGDWSSVRCLASSCVNRKWIRWEEKHPRGEVLSLSWKWWRLNYVQVLNTHGYKLPLLIFFNSIISICCTVASAIQLKQKHFLASGYFASHTFLYGCKQNWNTNK